MDLIAETQRGLADALPVLVMMSDPDGVVNFFNRAWFEYTGQPRFERDVGEAWRNYIHPDDVQAVGEVWQAAMLNGTDVQVEYRIHHAASGEWRWFSAHARALRDAKGTIVQWIGTAMEVHVARQAKEALETLYRQQRQVAEGFQRAALPAGLPAHPDLRFEAIYQPGSTDLLVGGDWYDAFALADGTIAVSVGDVNGHGLEAAVLMSRLRQSFRAVAIRAAKFQNTDPASVISSVEEIMVTESPDCLASAFFGLLDSQSKTLRFSNAGHPPALLQRRDGSIDELWSGDTLLGVAPGAPRESRDISLQNAAWLVCYTDGLIEMSRDIAEGERRLQAAIRNCSADATLSASNLLRRIVHAPAADDIAILTIAFEASRASRGSGPPGNRSSPRFPDRYGRKVRERVAPDAPAGCFPAP